MSEFVLEVKDLGINFGGLRAVDSLNLAIRKKQLYGLIGPNGAGKTTVFNMLTGVYTPTDGSIMLDGEEIVGKPAHKIARLGIARTFQNIRLFKEMTVKENVMIALDVHHKYSLAQGLLKTPKFWQTEKEIEEEAMRLLSVFDLCDCCDKLAKNLPYGKQRELEICRALGAYPKLLLLDEPAAGMNPQETENLMNIIRRVRDEFNVAILLIEHDMKLVVGICEEISVLNYGTLLASGDPKIVLNQEQVVKAYLGE